MQQNIIRNYKPLHHVNKILKHYLHLKKRMCLFPILFLCVLFVSPVFTFLMKAIIFISYLPETVVLQLLPMQQFYFLFVIR